MVVRTDVISKRTRGWGRTRGRHCAENRTNWTAIYDDVCACLARGPAMASSSSARDSEPASFSLEKRRWRRGAVQLNPSFSCLLRAIDMNPVSFVSFVNLPEGLYPNYHDYPVCLFSRLMCLRGRTQDDSAKVLERHLLEIRKRRQAAGESCHCILSFRPISHKEAQWRTKISRDALRPM